ncbi:hypothetical protein K0M31_007410 [Melipona bicolor]|uniref:Uncharacterized protein n=1 Tax=Melipona bicolor TaxID=60889 RepID=A0AA40GBM9_9HYME|nr:hypothetical protein K0M31_007410 [Melipona bicolor]
MLDEKKCDEAFGASSERRRRERGRETGEEATCANIRAEKEKKRDRETRRDRTCAVTVELRSQVLVHGRNGRIDLPSSPSLPPPSSSRAGSSNGTVVGEIIESEGEGNGLQCRACAAMSPEHGDLFYQVTEIYTSPEKSPKHPPCNDESDKGNKHRD